MCTVMLRVTTVILWFVGLVWGQTKYCCTPPQWESTTSLLDARLVANGTVATVTTGEGTVSIDGVAHMVASTNHLMSGGVPVSLKVIQIYNNRTQYTIQGNVCQKSSIAAWTPKCVPDNSKLLTSTYYGLPNNKVDVDIYELVLGANTVFATMTKTDCTVSAEAVYGSQAGTSAMSVRTFGNFSLGIKDRSVFHIPAICAGVTLDDPVPVQAFGFF